MAVLKKIRSRLWSAETVAAARALPLAPAPYSNGPCDIRPLTVTQLDECWRLDQNCFVDGEAYSRDTFEYLLTAAESVSYRAVTQQGTMIGFVVGLVEPDYTGHVTTLGVSPAHRRQGIANTLMKSVENGFWYRKVRLVRLEVRAVNLGAQQLYRNLGYVVTQRLPHYYSNGGDGLLMLKSLD